MEGQTQREDHDYETFTELIIGTSPLLVSTE